jgi:membrane-associated phospholipid phosphatase
VPFSVDHAFDPVDSPLLMRAALALLVLCWVAPVASVVLGASPAQAEEPATGGTGAGAARTGEPLTPPVRLRHDLWVDGAATAVLAGSLVAWSLAKSDALSSSCVICDGAAPGKVNALDDLFRGAFRRRDGAAAGTAGDIVTYGVGPAMGLALTVGAAVADGRGDEAPLDSLLVLESSLAAITVNEAVGAFIRRERPRVHALAGDAKSASLADSDAASSFPSGHTSSIMAITAATATVATLRGYRLAPLVWIVGSTVGLTATYLQLAADKSYFTDNLAGAAVGLGVGVLVPVLFHRRIESRPSAALRWIEGATLTSSTVPGGRVVGLGWAF